MSTPEHIWLLDDDPVFLARFSSSLRDYLQKQNTDFQLHAFTDQDALLTEAVRTKSVDLLISDIDLGSNTVTGIDIARKLRGQFPDCSIIYLTAYLHFATEIYETRPLYFILKSEYQERIPHAMAQFRRAQEEKLDTLRITIGKTTVAVPLSKLVYCEHSGRKTRLACADQEFWCYETIDELAKRLPQTRFVSCHKGYIVNLSYVQSYNHKAVTLKSGEVIPVSRSRYASLAAAFTAFLLI